MLRSYRPGAAIYPRLAIAALMILILALGASSSIPAAAQGPNAATMYDGEGANVRPERLALIIGVPTYQENFPSLPGVTKDALAMKEALRKIGVAIPRMVLPTDQEPYVLRKQIFQQLKEFWKDARLSSQTRGVPPVLIVYFAGHGFTHGEYSYLVPGDAFVTNSEDPERQAVRVSDVIAIMQGAEPLLSVVIIDACREFAFSDLAPLAVSGQRTPVIKGNDAAKSVTGVNGSLLLYHSTENGGVAKDSAAIDAANRASGPFAFALTKAIDAQINAIVADGPSARRRFFTEFAEDVHADVALLTNQGARPQLPDLYNQSRVKLPILTTEKDFEREQKVFNGFKTLIDSRGASLIAKYGFAKATEIIGQQEPCYYSDFIKQFGISYFWRDAAAKVQGRDLSACGQGLGELGVSAPVVSETVAANGAVAPSEVRTPPTAEQDANVQGALGKLKSAPAAASPPLPGTVALPTAPAAVGASPPPQALSTDVRLATVQTALNPRKNAKMIANKATTIDQPPYQGAPRRLVPIPAGTIVEFVRFETQLDKLYIYHPAHGYGFVASSDFVSAQGVLPMTFEIEQGALKPAQIALLTERVRELSKAGQISAVSIRYSIEGGARTLAAALEIASLVDEITDHNIQYLPQIASSSSLKPQFVELLAAVQLCKDTSSGSTCSLPDGVESKTAAEVLVGDTASTSAKAVAAPRIPVLSIAPASAKTVP